jgi:predicted ribosomally synthesized peptide with SipW-like signal peptide
MKLFLKGIGQNKAARLRKCKPYILLFSVLFALLTTTGSTLSWFTSADSITNTQKTPPAPNFRVTVVDVFTPPEDPPQPGDTVPKRVGAQNQEEKPAFVRLLVLPTFVIDGANPGDLPTVLPAVFGTHVIMEDFNSADWIDGGDGYYYYKHILAGGESTDDGWNADSLLSTDRNLFNSVSLPDPMPAGYENAHLVIEVKVEAVGIKPADAFINSWWDGAIPTASPLKDVHDALAALAQ